VTKLSFFSFVGFGCWFFAPHYASTIYAMSLFLSIHLSFHPSSDASFLAPKILVKLPLGHLQRRRRRRPIVGWDRCVISE